MVRAAPRYDDRLLVAIARLDRGGRSIADVCREVGTVAEALGLARPSYVHVRRLVHENRARAEAESERLETLREIAADVASRAAVGRYPNPYDVADRLRAVESDT